MWNTQLVALRIAHLTMDIQLYGIVLKCQLPSFSTHPSESVYVTDG